MGKNDRQSIDVTGLDMQKMDAESVDLGTKLWVRIESRFEIAPIVLVAPIINKGLRLNQRNALRPARYGFTLRPAGHRQATLEITERRLRYSSAERRGGRCGRRRRN